MSTHEHWIHRLSEYLDGELSAVERSAFENHAASCDACTTALRDLERVVAVAAQLGEIPPPRDLWPGIARGLSGRGGRDATHIRAPGAGAEVIALPTGLSRRAPRRGLFLSLPQVAAAVLVLVTGSALATHAVAPTDEVGSDVGRTPFLAPASSTDAPASVAEDLAALEEMLATARARLEPNTVRLIEKNLRVIEQAIEESRNALDLDPGNDFLRDHLDHAYERKVAYLREANRIADWAS